MIQGSLEVTTVLGRVVALGMITTIVDLENLRVLEVPEALAIMMVVLEVPEALEMIRLKM